MVMIQARNRPGMPMRETPLYPPLEADNLSPILFLMTYSLYSQRPIPYSILDDLSPIILLMTYSLYSQ